MKNILLVIGLTLILFASCVVAQQTVKEPSTEKIFPSEIKIKNGGKEYSLSVTGLAVRKKMFFKVYGIAHYMESFAKPGNEDDAYKSVLTDGKAKQITMDFARDVDAGKIKDAYKDGFTAHTSAEELQKIKPMVDQFIGYFSKDLKENDQIILRWMAGGTIIAVIQGEEKPAIVNESFARALWSIWFGKDSIVDREDLVRKMTAK
jgi:hypothetical protein